MEYIDGDPGDPPSWDYPMGGAPAAPSVWACTECEHEERVEIEEVEE